MLRRHASLGEPVWGRRGEGSSRDPVAESLIGGAEIPQDNRESVLADRIRAGLADPISGEEREIAARMRVELDRRLSRRRSRETDVVLGDKGSDRRRWPIEIE